MSDTIKKYFAEGIGTFFLVFFGTGAIIVDHQFGVLGHLGVSAAFGIVVMVVIYAFGSISGAHINPAVTIAFSLTDRFKKRLVPGYLIAQCIGALLGSALIGFILSPQLEWGQTIPQTTQMSSFFLEIVLTCLLMVVILFVSTDKRMYRFTGITVGSTVGLGALLGGPISGASMNPARSIAPALFSGSYDGLWIYMTAPIIGAAVASAIFLLIKGRAHKGV